MPAACKSEIKKRRGRPRKFDDPAEKAAAIKKWDALLDGRGLSVGAGERNWVDYRGRLRGFNGRSTLESATMIVNDKSLALGELSSFTHEETLGVGRRNYGRTAYKMPEWDTDDSD
jgi:hypothetical protein